MPINSSLIWLMSKNKTDFFTIESLNEKYVIGENGSLKILNLDYADEEFYACGYIASEKSLHLLSKFEATIKGL
jgi:hypothetical protein